MTDERGGRYFREARFFLAGDKVAAQSHILEARSLMGYMRDQHAMGGPAIQVKYATLQDGTQIKATMMNGQYQAQIISLPARDPRRRTDSYEIWVRPLAAPEDGDWLIELENGCLAKAELAPIKQYSNRMWEGADKSLYCIIGGDDDKKYTGTLGDTVSVDGEVILQHADPVAGVAVFRGSLVIIARVDTGVVSHPGTPTHPAAFVADTITYEVLVGGVSKLVTPVIDAYADGGYPTGVGNAVRFSQSVVVFNSDGSEGSCVLGDSKVLKFSLDAAEAGEVTVSYAITTIPSTNATFSEPTGMTGSYGRVVSAVPGGDRVETTTTEVVAKEFKVRRAVVCDYDLTDALVYCVVEEDRGRTATYNDYTIRESGGIGAVYDHYAKAANGSATGDIDQIAVTATVSFEGGAAGTTTVCVVKRGRQVGSSSWSESFYADGDHNQYPNYLATGSGASDSVTDIEGMQLQFSAAGVYEGMVLDDAPILFAVDVRHGFAIYSVAETLRESTTYSSVPNGDRTDFSCAGDVCGVDLHLNITTTKQLVTVAPRKIAARFYGGVEHVLHTFPAQTLDVADSYYYYPYDRVFAPDAAAPSSSTTTEPTMGPVESMYTLPRCAVLDDPYSRATGFVVPDGGEWVRAVAFIQNITNIQHLPDAVGVVPKAFSVCANGLSNITNEFDRPETSPLSAGGGIAEHFGVIHTRKKA